MYIYASKYLVCMCACVYGYLPPWCFCIRGVNTGKHAWIYFHITSQEHLATKIKHTSAKCPKVVNEIIKSFSRRL